MTVNGRKPYLVYDIKVVFEGRRAYCTEVIVQDIAECLQECECNQRIS